MQFTIEISIPLARERVIELFSDPENLKKWQPSLKEYTLLQGAHGADGAKSKMLFEMNGGMVEMIETVEKNRLPEEFVAHYETQGVTNLVINRFVAASETVTQWVTVNHFEFKGLMALLALFMRTTFRKQTISDMERFRDFALESQQQVKT